MSTKKEIQRKMNAISKSINKLGDMISDCSDLPSNALIYFEAGGSLCIVDPTRLKETFTGNVELLMESSLVCYYDCGGF